jgi:hypothetical protein
MGHAVVQLVEALRHKLEGRSFDSRWSPWNFLLIIILPIHYVLLLTQMSDRKIASGCLELKNLPTSCGDCLEILEPQTPGNLRACPEL